MKKIFYKTDRSNYSNKLNKSKGKSFYDINSTDIVDKKFDLKGYLSFMEKQIELEKKLKNKRTTNLQKLQTEYAFHSHNSSNIVDMNNSSKYTSTNYNNFTHKKIRSDSCNIFYNPINNNTLGHTHGFSTFTNSNYNSIFDRSQKSYIQNINKSKTSQGNKRIYNKIKYAKTHGNEDNDSDDEDDEKNFSVSKTVKEIRKNCFLTSLSKNYKYNKKHADIISDSNKILTNFKNKDHIKIEEEGKIISTFLNQNKEISKKNKCR